MSLLIVMAHPDDESMGNGGMIFRHARAGVDVHLICATRGGAGWGGKPAGRRPEELPAIRTQELERAATVLGIQSLELWDYPDGDVAGCSQEEITQRIAATVRRRRPDVVVGWGPDGAYGHPDHIALGACTDLALAGFGGSHYQMAVDRPTEAAYRHAFDLVGEDGGGLPLVSFDELSITFVLSQEELAAKAAAIACHESQIEPWREQMDERPEIQRGVLGHDSYRRVGGPFEGMRQAVGIFPELGRIGSLA